MENKENIQVIRPFGPSIAKIKIPNKIIEHLNNYVDKIIQDEKKSKILDHGKKLAGNVSQEIKLEADCIEKSGYLNFLYSSVNDWLYLSDKKKIKKFTLISSWIVRQFQNEYNPVHWHGGHISGVGYLKTPSTFGEHSQNKKNNSNGKLEFIHGTKQFSSPSSMIIKPEVGYHYFFPHYLMHLVYPFNGSNEERRSISFNAFIDHETFNVYGN